MRPANYPMYKALGLPRPSRKLFRILRGPYGIHELAAALDCDTNTILQWEQAIAQPSPPYLRQLVDHYLMCVRKYGRDPLRLMTKPSRPGVPSATPRRAARLTDKRCGTPPAPTPTAGEAQPSLPFAPPLAEGGEENLSPVNERRNP